MSRKIKRASIIAIIIYVMINSFVWGLMKAYINSHNAISHDKLAMAQVTDSPNGKKISVMGTCFYIPDKREDKSRVDCALQTLIPIKIRTASEIFRQTGQKIAEEIS